MASSIERAFAQDCQTVFDAAKIVIVRLGYKLDSADSSSGVLCFKTGMSWFSWAGQEMSLLISRSPSGGTVVSASGRMNQSGVSIQVYDWGEAKGIARRVLDALQQYLEQVTPTQTAALPGATGPGKFRVSGVDKETHMDCSLVVRADSAANAKVKAELQDMIVTEVVRVE